MSNATEEKRAQELIMQYNAYQNPEEVISEMAYRIADLEDELQASKLQVEYFSSAAGEFEGDIISLSKENDALNLKLESLETQIDDYRIEVRQLEIECREAYREGVQEGRESCDGRY